MKPDQRSPWGYLADRPGLLAPINRHTLGIALVGVPVIFGALALGALGMSRATVSWVLVIVALFGGIGGWVHPPHRSLRPRTALAGVVIAVGALVASASVRRVARWGSQGQVRPRVRVANRLGWPAGRSALRLARATSQHGRAYAVGKGAARAKVSRPPMRCSGQRGRGVRGSLQGRAMSVECDDRLRTSGAASNALGEAGGQGGAHTNARDDRCSGEGGAGSRPGLRIDRVYGRLGRVRTCGHARLIRNVRPI